MSGARSVERGMQEGTVFLLIASSEMSQNALDRLTYNKDIPVIQVYSAEEMSTIIGKKNRHIIGITDPSMAKAMLEFSEQEVFFDEDTSI